MCREEFKVHACIIALGFGLTAGAYADEVSSTLTDQKNVAVTIYNQDLALIKEQRSVKLPAGPVDLALRDVSAKMRPETASLRTLTTGHQFEILEQNFDFDLLTPLAMLQKYVGRTVGIVRTHPTNGAETVERAEILSAADGVVLKIGDRIETGVPGRIVYDAVPGNLRDRPTLVTKLVNKQAGEQRLELSYLSGGLGWQADYVAELDINDQYMNLHGWVTLTNQSGATYNNATLQLVAGDVHRVPVRDDNIQAMPPAMELMRSKRDTGMAEESLLEYHLYTLPRPTTIKDNQTKQVSMLDANQVTVTKQLILQGYDFFYRSLTPVWSGEYKVAVQLNI